MSRAARALTLIASLPEGERTVGNIANGLGATLATTYHLLNTLIDAKLLARDAAKCYQLGSHIGVLAAAYERQRTPPVDLMQPLKDLADSTGETAYLSVWHGGDIEIQAQFTGHHAVQVANLRPGFHGEAHARASGKTLLAFAEADVRQRYLATHAVRPLTAHTITGPKALSDELKLIRNRGYATEEEEFSVGVACMAVPIMVAGYLVGAYTISAPIERYRDQKTAYLERLRSAAGEAGAAVGSTGPNG